MPFEKVIFILSIYICSVNSTFTPTHLLLRRTGPCHGMPKTIISVSEFTIARVRYNFTLNAVINISADIPNGWKIKGTMQKCQDVRNLDTCDLFNSMPLVRDGCFEDNQDIDLLFHSTEPRISCPIRAGSYKLKNYHFFTKDNSLMVSESKISTSVFGYTYRMEGYGDEDKILCVDSILQLVYLRKHFVESSAADDVTNYETTPKEQTEDKDTKPEEMEDELDDNINETVADITEE